MRELLSFNVVFNFEMFKFELQKTKQTQISKQTQ